ncbi:MAG: pyrimidine dimer DNA glycosylase/endonuclease V [Candidatus Nanohaloarchaea archaeon]|nr:pyrimidine dimer DNA glycosylase/endonuclease V [Candidatus Nanohaloarchaea archaeon]
MTRMWMVDPRGLCRQHLLGEHRELHQEVGLIRAGHLAAVRGHARERQVDTARIVERHETLVAEMDRRGFDHSSPMDYEDDLELGEVDAAANREELKERCEACRERMED